MFFELVCVDMFFVLNFKITIFNIILNINIIDETFLINYLFCQRFDKLSYHFQDRYPSYSINMPKTKYFQAKRKNVKFA